MSKTLLSIVIPTKNRVECVNALTSDLVLLRGYNSKKIEIIVLDNATPSADYSLPSGVRLHRHPSDIGAIRNIITAIHFANSEYVWILGDDDSLRTDTFESLLCLLGEREPSLVRLKHVYVETNEILNSFTASELTLDKDKCAASNIFNFNSYGVAAIRSFEDKAGFISANIFSKKVLIESLRICRDLAPVHVYESNVYMTKLYAAVALYLCGGYWESQEILVKQRIPQIGRNFMDTGSVWFRNFLEAPAEVYNSCSSLNQELAKELLRIHYNKNVDFRYAANSGVPIWRCFSYIKNAAWIAGLDKGIRLSIECLRAYLKK